MKIPPNERPSARELASGGDLWICSVCGCRDWRVLDTREASGGNVGRTRYCRHCGPTGPRIYTEETPYRSSVSSVPDPDIEQFSPLSIAACRRLEESA